MATTHPQNIASESRIWTFAELAEAITEAFPDRFVRREGRKIVRWKMHPDTLVKCRRFGTTKGITAKQLEAVTGIDRRCFIWPDEFGDPWPEILGG